jgi:hypothetical protein
LTNKLSTCAAFASPAGGLGLGLLVERGPTSETRYTWSDAWATGTWISNEATSCAM